tara:strand:- start:122 stop:922 length:801 start_codon:yes stop_codon:yes gene_type:complete
VEGGGFFKLFSYINLIRIDLMDTSKSTKSEPARHALQSALVAFEEEIANAVTLQAHKDFKGVVEERDRAKESLAKALAENEKLKAELRKRSSSDGRKAVVQKGAKKSPSTEGKAGRFAGWNSFCKMEQKIRSNEGETHLSKKELSHKWKNLSPEAKAKWRSYAAIKTHKAWVPPKPARLAHCVTCARSICWKDEEGKRECGCWPCEECACGLDEQCDPEEAMEEYRQYLKEQRREARKAEAKIAKEQVEFFEKFDLALRGHHPSGF